MIKSSKTRYCIGMDMECDYKSFTSKPQAIKYAINLRDKNPGSGGPESVKILPSGKCEHWSWWIKE